MFDTARFEEAVLALLPRLKRYARLLSRDAGLAEDLLQDTLERAWAGRHTWRPGTDARPWLFAIMHNTHFSSRRRAAARPQCDAMDTSALDDPSRAPHLAHNEYADPAALIDMQRAVDALPEEQRDVLLLVVVEQLPYREVAEVLDVPIGTVMSRLARARDKLRQRLGAPASSTHLRVVK